ncbi:hypothetical protein MPLSOD_40593 [Mesorhizobium sp. SOD10]|nr:hypothetical protein MPLSOD_40593 [Mesorhizobium sp. SOD10]
MSRRRRAARDDPNQVAIGPRLTRQQERRGLLASGNRAAFPGCESEPPADRAGKSPAINLPYGHGPRSVSQLPALTYTLLDGRVSGADVREVSKTSCTNLGRALACLAIRDRGRYRPAGSDARGRAVGDIADP